MKRLNYGPRYGVDGSSWVCPDGDPADDRDVGFEATVDDDGCIRIAIGDREQRQEWELSPAEARELVSLLDPDLVYINQVDLERPETWPEDMRRP